MYVFTKYSNLGASSRVRFFKYLDLGYINEPIDGINTLFDDKYVDALYKNNKKKSHVLLRYVIRFISFLYVLFNTKIKIVWIEKELFPYIPFPFELLLSFFGKKVIYDFDDAVFHNYNNSKLSSLFNLKFKSIMSFSDLVFAGNKYLYKSIKLMGAKNVHLIPTVVNFNEYLDKRNNYDRLVCDTNCVKVGWIGTPSTQKYLSIVDNAIHKLQSELSVNVELYLIGVNSNLKLKSKFTIVNWTESTEIETLLQIDIGIMPLFDSSFEKGKCGYKIIQYFACGKPVLASPIGVNVELISDGNNGYLCKNENEWYTNLKNLILDSNKRGMLGTNGCGLVADKYSYSVQSINISNAIMELKNSITL